MNGTVSTRAALALTVSFSLIGLVLGFVLGYNAHNVNQPAASPKKCAVMSLDKAESLTHDKNLTQLANSNNCIFMGASGNQALGISWKKDPNGSKFDQSARAVYCEKPEPFSVDQACWGSKRMDIFFVKKGLLVTVNTDAAHNDNNLLDMASAVANNI